MIVVYLHSNSYGYVKLAEKLKGVPALSFTTFTLLLRLPLYFILREGQCREVYPLFHI